MRVISRDQEARLYKHLQANCEGDALQYELLARKVQRCADGVATEWEQGIALDHLEHMLDGERAKAALLPRPLSAEEMQARELDRFAEVRAGVVGNPRYQAFLDTLSAAELAGIRNNVPYFTWFSCREREAAAAGIPLGVHIAKWSSANLSDRGRARREAEAQKDVA